MQIIENNEVSLKNYKNLNTILTDRSILADNKLQNLAIKWLNLFMKDDLLEIVKELGIKNYSKCNKTELCYLLIKELFSVNIQEIVKGEDVIKIKEIDSNIDITDDVKNILIVLLNKFNKDSILKIAKDREVKGYSKLDKLELMRLLVSNVNMNK
jgi:hypothetical protein